jgi:hypothetical protein
MENARKMRNLQESPHPAFSHLLPEGEEKKKLAAEGRG